MDFILRENEFFEKVGTDGYCNHEIKDACSLEENLDSVLKSRDISLLTKVHLVKAMVFPAVMYGCSTIKKGEH